MKHFLKHLLQRAGRVMIGENLATRSFIGEVPVYPDPRAGASVKISMAAMALELQGRALAGMPLPRLMDSGFRVFSQFEEDGLLAYLAAVLELSPKIFIDIGAADGISSNCANLALNLGWHGLFIDGNHAAIERGRAFYHSHPDTSLFPPLLKQAFITAENINQLIKDAGFVGDVGCVSIDLDGNDCWVWNALQIVSPAVVVIESHIEFGAENIAVPYDPAFVHSENHPDYFGASAPAMVSLGRKKGYRLVGANRFGFNLLFVREDIFPDRVPAVSVDSVLTHSRHRERLSLGASVRDMPFVSL